MEKENSISELVEIMEILRSERGCPWDREQTHESIAHNLLEEAYEAYEAILKRDIKHLKEELGDLLLQVVFHSQIAKERGDFDIYDVAGEIVEKLKRRHPHVFGTESIETSREVLSRWEDIKKSEKEEKESNHTLDSVPKSMPSLLYALNIQKKASRLGFDWRDARPVLEKVEEELEELKESYESFRSKKLERDAVEEELGDVFFALINFARLAGIDPEFSLRKVTEKFVDRVKYVEQIAFSEGIDLNKASLEDLDRLWEIAKKDLNSKQNPERGDE